eukprot:4016600-Prymnesium_polylepis.1
MKEPRGNSFDRERSQWACGPVPQGSGERRGRQRHAGRRTELRGCDTVVRRLWRRECDTRVSTWHGGRDAHRPRPPESGDGRAIRPPREAGGHGLRLWSEDNLSVIIAKKYNSAHALDV